MKTVRLHIENLPSVPDPIDQAIYEALQKAYEELRKEKAWQEHLKH